jgi:hypothetical protein
MIKFLFKFVRLAILLDAPKNLFRKKVVRFRGRLGSKGLCDHPYKKIQKAPKTPLKSPFFDILYGALTIPCEPATNVALLLWPVRSWYDLLVSKISKINEENYKKINSVFNRPVQILYNYYYC